jgi:hypothetical protein
VHLDAGYGSQKTRDELAGRGVTGEIARKGGKAPIQAGQRRHVKRTSAWHGPCTDGTTARPGDRDTQPIRASSYPVSGNSGRFGAMVIAGDEAESSQCARNAARLAGPEIETPAVWLIVLRQLVRSHAVSEGTEGACSDACVWSVGVVVQVAGVVQPCWGGPDPASVG